MASNITSEERDELRQLLAAERAEPPSTMLITPGVLRLAVAAVNALPGLLDALDAAERDMRHYKRLFELAGGQTTTIEFGPDGPVILNCDPPCPRLRASEEKCAELQAAVLQAEAERDRVAAEHRSKRHGGAEAEAQNYADPGVADLQAKNAALLEISKTLADMEAGGS